MSADIKAAAERLAAEAGLRICFGQCFSSERVAHIHADAIMPFLTDFASEERESIARWHEQEAAEAEKRMMACDPYDIPLFSQENAIFSAHSESARAVRAGRAKPKEKA